MRGRGAVAALAAALVLPAPLAGQAGWSLATVQLPAGHEVRWAGTADLDGDGRPDLLVGASRDSKERPRALLAFVQPEGAGPPALQEALGLDLPADVLGLAAADLHADPGDEALLGGASGVFALRWRGSPRERLVKIGAADLLWQFPGRRDVLDLSGLVADFDRDGLADLVVPEPGGYRPIRQSAGEGGIRTFTALPRLAIPASADAEEPEEAGGAFRIGPRRRVEIRLPFPTSGQIPDGEPFLEVSDRVPSPHLRDLDGDGDLDVTAQTGSRFLAWAQAGGAFAAAPAADWKLPVPEGRDRRFDISASSHAADLDGDGKVDAVMFIGDRNAKEARTQILVFTQGTGGRRKTKTAESPLFGTDGIPDDLLVLGGFPAAPQLADLDGDGRIDLAAGVFKPESADPLGGKSGAVIDARLHVWRNQGGRFERAPAATLDLEIPADGLRGGGRGLVARFIPDADGDGAAELLLRSEPGRLRILALRKRGRDGLAFDERPVFETRIDEDARVRWQGDRAGAPGAVLVIEDGQVQVVRRRP